MPSSKRLLPWSGDEDRAGDDDGGGGGELSRPRKRWRSIVGQARERAATMEGVLGFRGMMGEEFMGMFLPFFARMVQKVVSEEVGRVMSRQLSAPAAPPRLLIGQNQRPRYQLMFLNGLKPVYTMMKLEAKDGPALKMAIIERLEDNQSKIVRFGHLSSVKVEVVVLHGHFNAKNEECWTPEEFNKHIVCGREKSAQLLTGNLTLKLNGGEASLENANFTDNSSFTSTKKFRLGLRLANDSGEMVLEGITEPFPVKERRVEGFEKHYPPLLDDEVWRLERIRKDGAYHQALSSSGIDTVQKFLKSYVKNEQKLLQNFRKMPQATWRAIIGHALTCEVDEAVYSYEIKEYDTQLFFDTVYRPVGVKFGSASYMPIDELGQVEKNLVETLKQVAYENVENFQYNHTMINSCPVPLHRFYKGTSVLCNVLPDQQTLNYGQYNSSLGECFTSQGVESKERLWSFQGSTSASMKKSRFVHGQTSNAVQFSHLLVENEVIQCNPSQGIFLPGTRITKLQIPNTEIAEFVPDVTLPTVVHGNIHGDQVAMQFGQHGQKQSPFSEEPYSSFLAGGLSSTDTAMGFFQTHSQLTSNGDSFRNQPDLLFNDQAITQSHQVVTGFQPSRSNSFDSENDQLITRFISQYFRGEGPATRLSPRKWLKIKAILNLVSVGRLSRASRRSSHTPPTRPRLVPTI